MLRRNIGFMLVLMLLFSTFTTSVYAQGDTNQASTLIELKVSNNLLSMTEAREIEIEIDFGYKANLSQLKWTFGGKDFTEWKQWNNDTKDYRGVPGFPLRQLLRMWREPIPLKRKLNLI